MSVKTNTCSLPSLTGSDKDKSITGTYTVCLETVTIAGEISTHSGTGRHQGTSVSPFGMNEPVIFRLYHFSTDWQLLCCCQEADCGSSALALRAAAPLGQWSLLLPCMWCVASPDICGLIPSRAWDCIVACCFSFYFSVPRAKQNFSNSATQHNGSESGMFILKTGDNGFLS